MSWSVARNERITKLDEAMSYLLRLHKEVAEGEFKASLESGETQNCFPIIMSYCRDITEAKDMSGAWHGAER